MDTAPPFRNANVPSNYPQTHSAHLHTPTSSAHTLSTNANTPVDSPSPPSSKLPQDLSHRYDASRIPVTLESFNRLTYLPTHLVKAIFADLTQFWAPSALRRKEPGQVPCLWFDDGEYSQAKFTFGFRGEESGETMRIEVPVTDLVYRAGKGLSGEWCYMGIVETQEENAALGTGVLKNGYWVFDAKTTSVRAANGEYCGSKVVRWEEGRMMEGECGGGKRVGGVKKAGDKTAGEKGMEEGLGRAKGKGEYIGRERGLPKYVDLHKSGGAKGRIGRWAVVTGLLGGIIIL
ncbi:hypothetical protein QBC36DRAFT_183798 [Triangularia setosa]|uniref:Peptidase A1 domain-containing protein n=1 Tax=Triangularia setosa TaxID=2587417 RepID=A0AAN6W9W7_9PEZI|nr:hypothetical protein QBC36DRAFT_183798 [Podospora setosa]